MTGTNRRLWRLRFWQALETLAHDRPPGTVGWFLDRMEPFVQDAQAVEAAWSLLAGDADEGTGAGMTNE